MPGILLSAAVTLIALLLETLQRRLLGSVLMDGLVLAIIIGTLIHTAFGLSDRFVSGVNFAAKRLLELAIVLLGASVSLSALSGNGMMLFIAVMAMVAISLLVSYSIGRFLGLPPRLCLLVACGNSICGNSAIVAAAPAVHASHEEVTASIAFTAALGIVVVMLLPLSFSYLSISQTQYGMLAGMTVYAVPQVLAATLPIGTVSAQMGTVIKLMRVLMLGPVVLTLGLMHKRQEKTAGAQSGTPFIPWFITGFLALIVCRALGLLPDMVLEPLHQSSTALTTISMAALGLSVNLRAILSSGGRVLAAGALSIIALAGLSLAAVHLLPMS
ncbi:YeiH family protein [Allorhizobium undicola]|uniref:YeiH family protein n=1 Tax=Allorhizobium undicola TaxID=78527 RepID=UPI002E803ACA|nr:putative sulfate exporter family transporter [Allorhizobium undicola]